jgi:catechol 2,3-dioxygenase-like lactoylglutathione lyase family enzyme
MKFIYTGIHVSDLDRSIKFYTKELKMKLLFRAEIKETGGKDIRTEVPPASTTSLTRSTTLTKPTTGCRARQGVKSRHLMREGGGSDTSETPTGIG